MVLGLHGATDGHIFVHYNNREEALNGLTATDIARITYDGRFDCLKMLDRRPVPWDICWDIVVYRCGGLALHPTQPWYAT